MWILCLKLSLLPPVLAILDSCSLPDPTGLVLSSFLRNVHGTAINQVVLLGTCHSCSRLKCVRSGRNCTRGLTDKLQLTTRATHVAPGAGNLWQILSGHPVLLLGASFRVKFFLFFTADDLSKLVSQAVYVNLYRASFPACLAYLCSYLL